jgi:hypothetical protein
MIQPAKDSSIPSRQTAAKFMRNRFGCQAK